MLSNTDKESRTNGASAVSVRAAITGASCRLPGAENLDAFWELMKSRGHGLRHSPPGRYEALDVTPQYIKSIEEIGHDWGGYIDGPDMFDPVVFGMSRIEASSTDPQHRLLMEVVWEALENACEAPDQLAGSRTGVFVGLCTFDYAMFLSAFDPYGDLVTPFSSPGSVHSIAANRISYMLDLHGPSMAIDTACSSSSYALHMALRSLEQGECDTAIVCGANMIMTPYVTKGFKRARMLAKDGLVKCFDEKTDGYIRGEGAVALIIRREDDAIKRGNRIMGVIGGSAVNHDGKTKGLFAPSRERQIELIRSAHTAANIDQTNIGFVEAHGTGTYMGDQTELNALNTIFTGERDTTNEGGPCYVGSVKSNLGHLEAVSGLAGLLKAVLCLQKGEIPGQANLTKPMPAATASGARIVVPGESVAWPRTDFARWAGVTSLGFGGANSHIVIEEPPQVPDPIPGINRPIHVLKLSAKKPEQIAQMANRLQAALERQPDLALGDICHSTNIGRSDFEQRALIIAKSRDDLARSLNALSKGTPRNTIATGKVGRGGHNSVMLLAGDTAPYYGIGRGLYDSEPRFAAHIDAADELLHKLAGVSLVSLLYSDQNADGSPITDPAQARVVLFATQYAVARLLLDVGVKPTVIVSSGVGDQVLGVLQKKRSFEQGLKAAFNQSAPCAADDIKSGLEAALADGAQLVVEIGPRTQQRAGLSEPSAPGDVTLTACLSKDTDDCEQLANVLAQLYVSGTNIDWLTFDAPFQRRRLVLPTYPFARERFWFTDEGPAPGTTVEQNKAVTSNQPDLAPQTKSRAPTNGAAPATAVITRSELFEFMRSAIAAATSVPLSDINEDTQFTDVELDSVAGLELLLRLDKMLGIMPDPQMFADDMTFGAAIDALHELAKTAPLKRGVSPNGSEAAKPLNGAAPKTARLHNGASSRPTDGDAETQAAAFLDDLNSGQEATDYLDAVRPDFTAALHEMLLDVEYDTANGDHLSGTRFGVPISAIDMLGGFGSTLFGHNHPALVGVLKQALAQSRPNFVQMSNRTAAGTLAAQLIARVAKTTGRDYNAVLGSTGAEMVDAALKHALFEWSRRRQDFVSSCSDDGSDAPTIANKPPVVLAIEGSYHGKTLGAYALTWHAPGRDEMGLNGPFEVVWLPRDDEAAATKIFRRYQFELTTQNSTNRYSRIAGLFVEPVQGEGGIFPLAKSFAATLRSLADDAGCPIIVDEIQSGIGRTGAFTAAETIDLRGDYYLFGKSLGGGLTKTTALLIDTKRYAPGYGFAHTSTFGEDDHGALVALRALQLLDDDNIEERARDAGDYLLKRLREVKARFPGILLDVRGCGLMVGVELASQKDNQSQLISGLSDQGLLGIFVTSHLLHRSGIRVGTALSRPSTLRFEPSAYISKADMDLTAQGIEAVCRIIDAGDAADLVRHLAQGYRRDGKTPFKLAASPTIGTGETVAAPAAPANKQAVFLGHMIDSDDIRLLDKSLLSLSESERENLAARLIDPVLVKRVPLLSSCGETLDFEIHSLPLTSRAIVSAMRDGQSERVVEQVNSAVAQFAQKGARVVGLGGLLSVITRNGLSVRNDFKNLQITTGNTYTVALAAEAVIRTSNEQGIDKAHDRVGLIGAGGNIGSTLAQILSEHFQKLRLIGRKQSIKRVENTAIATYDMALSALQSRGKNNVTGLARALADEKLTALVSASMCPTAANGAGPSSGARLRKQIIEHYGEDPFLPVSEDIEALRDCAVIVTASNAIAPILNPENIGKSTRIICDVSVPSDVDPALLEARPDITVIRGGVAKAPEKNSFTFDMIDLPQNHLLACMTETALLGFSGKQGFDAIGEIQASGVRECHELGLKYGFELGYSSLSKPFAIELG